MIRFACPGCGAVYTVGDEKAGKTGKCPKCAAQFEIPTPSPAAPPPPPVDVFAPRSSVPPPPAHQPPPLPPAVTAVVELPCPHCRGQLAVNASDLGTSVECPHCKKVFTATRPGAAQPTAPAPPKPQRTLDDVLGGASRRSEDDEDRPSRRGRPRTEDEEDDRPSRRRRPARDDDEEDNDRPSRRRRRRDDDEDEDDRPRRRRREEGSPALGIVSLVTGILAIIFLCCCVYVSPLFSLIAIVTGVIGLKFPGRGMAIAGLLCGILAILLGILFVILGLGMNLLGQAIQQNQVQQQRQNPPFGPQPFR